MKKKPSIIGFKADEKYTNMIEELIKYFEKESSLNVTITYSDVLRYAVEELYRQKITLKRYK